MGMKKILNLFEIFGTIGIGTVAICKMKKDKKEISEKRDFSEKMLTYYRILNRWLMLKQQGKSLTEYFYKNEFHSIAIYGYRELGQRLYDELKETDIEVKYIIDKNIDTVSADVDIYTPDAELPYVDVIVITATYYYDEIEDELYDAVEYPIISLEDVLV